VTRRVTWTLVIMSSFLCLGGCNPFRRVPKASRTPAVPPRPFPIETLERHPSPPPLVPMPPEIDLGETTPAQPPPWLASLPPVPPPPPVIETPPPRPPGEVIPTKPPPRPVPRLRQLLDAATLQAYQAEIDQRLARVRAMTDYLAKRSLGRDQRRLLAQVQSLADQAARLRDTDPVAARSLAERADLLAQDLKNSIK